MIRTILRFRDGADASEAATQLHERLMDPTSPEPSFAVDHPLPAMPAAIMPTNGSASTPSTRTGAPTSSTGWLSWPDRASSLVTGRPGCAPTRRMQLRPRLPPSVGSNPISPLPVRRHGRVGTCRRTTRRTALYSKATRSVGSIGTRREIERARRRRAGPLVPMIFDLPLIPHRRRGRGHRGTDRLPGAEPQGTSESTSVGDGAVVQSVPRYGWSVAEGRSGAISRAMIAGLGELGARLSPVSV